jgi:transposase-like protein
MKKKIKNYRYSQNFKDAVLQEVRKGELSIISISRLYDISYVTVYKWMKDNLIPTPDKETIYVDLKDHKGSLDKIRELEKKIQQLETVLSDKVLENCALQAMVNVAKKKYGIDLKKKSDKPASKNAEK